MWNKVFFLTQEGRQVQNVKSRGVCHKIQILNQELFDLLLLIYIIKLQIKQLLFKSMEIKNSHELSYFHTQVINTLEYVMNYYQKQDNLSLSEEDYSFFIAIQKFSKGFVSLSKYKRNSGFLHKKNSFSNSDLSSQISVKLLSSDHEKSDLTCKKRMYSEALEPDKSTDILKKQRRWWQKCELKYKKKSLSPPFQESSSCKNFRSNKTETRYDKTNYHSQISTPQKNKKTEDRMKIFSSTNLQKQKQNFSVQNLPTNLPIKIQNKNEKNPSFCPPTKDQQNEISSFRCEMEAWRKVVNTSKVHPNSLFLRNSTKKVQSIENEILTPQQIREVFMKKKTLKINERVHVPRSVTEYR